MMETKKKIQKFHFNYCCWSILIINDLGVNRIKSAQKRKIKGNKQMNMQGALYEGYEDMLENVRKHFFFFFKCLISIVSKYKKKNYYSDNY